MRGYVFLLLKGFLQIITEVLLVVFNSQDVIRFFADDLSGNVLLTAHRINGDQTAFNIQQVQQSRDGGDLITLVIDLLLCQYHVISIAPGTDHVNDGFTTPFSAVAHPLTVYADDSALR